MTETKASNRRLTRLELSNKPTLVITEKLQKQIDYLHGKVKNSEWSGELITREEGKITDLQGWKIFGEDIFLADIGSPGYTEYELDKGGFKAVDVVAMYEKFEGLLEGELKNQHIHTHHSMNAFFSGTDWENLEDRASASNYCLMLVVNFSGKYCAKVAFKANVKNDKKSIISFANNADGFSDLTMEDDTVGEVLVVMDCIIEYEKAPQMVDDWFSERFDGVTKAIEEDKKVKASQKELPFPSRKDEKADYEDWEGWKKVNGKKDKKDKKKEKKISEMTNKEWEEFNKKTNSKVGSVVNDSQWQYRHVFILLNSVINNSFEVDFLSPIPRISEIERKFRDAKDRNEFLITVQFTMREKFDAMFYPKTTDDNYLDLLTKTIEFLDGYKYNVLADGIMDICWEEIGRFEKMNDYEDTNFTHENTHVL